MANTNAQIIKLVFSSRTEFETETAGIDGTTQPIAAFIDAATKEYGVKLAGGYAYFADSRAAISALEGELDGMQDQIDALAGALSLVSGGVSSLSATVAAQNTQIAILEGLISSSFPGGLDRGRFAPLTVGSAATQGVRYFEPSGSVAFGVYNPMTGVVVEDKYEGTLRLPIYVNSRMLSTYNKTNTAIGLSAFFLRAVVADDTELRIYDTQENAETGGSTGWIGVCPTIPDMTPGTWPIRHRSGSTTTDQTFGWIVARNGVNLAAYGPSAWGLYLKSRDFSFQRNELQPGFEMTVNFGFKVELSNPYGGYPYVTVNATIGGVSLSLNLARVKGWPDPANQYESGYYSGKVTMSVVDRYTASGTEDVVIRTAITFDNVESHIGTAAYTKAIGQPAITENIIPVHYLNSQHNFLDVSVQAYGAVSDLIFCGSSANVKAPVIIE